jgi:Na+/melibiose symporter-like transporter
MKKALLALVVIVAVVAAFALWSAWQPRRTPSGQPPLESLNLRNLSDFETAFNNSPSSVRMVLLLSPT